MHASIWMPFPPPIWQCIGLQLNTESSWANPKIDRKGGSSSAARKNQCGTRSTRLVKSSEIVDKSKPRDVWDIWDICNITWNSTFQRLVILQSRPNTPRSAAGEDDEVLIGEVNTDDLIKLLTRLETFSCPGHQELATQCKKRNPGGENGVF